jgi:hypothetical protein
VGVSSDEECKDWTTCEEDEGWVVTSDGEPAQRYVDVRTSESELGRSTFVDDD